MVEFDSLTANKARLEVRATVIRACANCGAPGVVVDEHGNKTEEPVGPICPNCGAKRPDDEDKGVIYDTRWFTWWGKILRKIGLM